MLLWFKISPLRQVRKDSNTGVLQLSQMYKYNECKLCI
jgi:hypothetical protein